MKGKVGGQWNKIFVEIFRSVSRVFLLLSPALVTKGRKDLDPHGGLRVVQGRMG